MSEDSPDYAARRHPQREGCQKRRPVSGYHFNSSGGFLRFLYQAGPQLQVLPFGGLLDEYGIILRSWPNGHW
jgi:hypothetical protein